MRIVLVMLFLIVYSCAFGEELKFITHELKPFTWKDESDGKMKGIVYDLCKDTIISMGYENPKIEVYPFVRVLKTVQNEKNYVVFHVARTEEREKTMKWVGPIISNGVYFFRKKGEKFPAETLEDMKKISAIGVGRANASEAFLKKNGFTNLYDVTNEMQAMQMLELGRVDAVPVGEMVVHDLAKQGDVDMKKIEKTKVKLMDSLLYMGFSYNIPDCDIKKWQETFEKVKNTHYEELLKKYIED